MRLVSYKNNHDLTKLRQLKNTYITNHKMSSQNDLNENQTPNTPEP